MINGFSHLGIATRSIEESARFYRLLGFRVAEPEEIEDQKVKVLFIETGSTRIELLEPTHPDSPIARFLERRGPGMHHIALEVDDLDSVLEHLAQQGVRLIDRQPRPGAEGRRIAFVHPESTGGVLVELCDAGGRPDRFAASSRNRETRKDTPESEGYHRQGQEESTSDPAKR